MAYERDIEAGLLDGRVFRWTAKFKDGHELWELLMRKWIEEVDKNPNTKKPSLFFNPCLFGFETDVEFLALDGVLKDLAKVFGENLFGHDIECGDLLDKEIKRWLSDPDDGKLVRSLRTTVLHYYCEVEARTGIRWTGNGESPLPALLASFSWYQNGTPGEERDFIRANLPATWTEAPLLPPTKQPIADTPPAQPDKSVADGESWLWPDVTFCFDADFETATVLHRDKETTIRLSRESIKTTPAEWKHLSAIALAGGDIRAHRRDAGNLSGTERKTLSRLNGKLRAAIPACGEENPIDEGKARFKIKTAKQDELVRLIQEHRNDVGEVVKSDRAAARALREQSDASPRRNKRIFPQEDNEQ